MSNVQSTGDAANRTYLMDFLERQKLPKAEFAKIIGVTPSAVNHWLTGIRDIPETVVRLLLFFDDYNIDMRKFYDESA